MEPFTSICYFVCPVRREFVEDTELRRNMQFKDKFCTILMWHLRHANYPYLCVGVRRWRRHHKIVNFLYLKSRKLAILFCFCGACLLLSVALKDLRAWRQEYGIAYLYLLVCLVFGK
ncbi:uncharacterized protein LOC117145607 [Drosophila mauritiana]|uniref:Uncharacterized protein LOC117145607 n=1 Tax=Drosophila mauritiana TaxID=7226 RepID=A0A6P8KEB5_DROMA|nr:uncharacterized protein LOC117145607 [Drosophila mauritiana]